MVTEVPKHVRSTKSLRPSFPVRPTMGATRFVGRSLPLQICRLEKGRLQCCYGRGLEQSSSCNWLHSRRSKRTGVSSLIRVFEFTELNPKNWCTHTSSCSTHIHVAIFLVRRNPSISWAKKATERLELWHAVQYQASHTFGSPCPRPLTSTVSSFVTKASSHEAVSRMAWHCFLVEQIQPCCRQAWPRSVVCCRSS